MPATSRRPQRWAKRRMANLEECPTLDAFCIGRRHEWKMGEDARRVSRSRAFQIASGTVEVLRRKEHDMTGRMRKTGAAVAALAALAAGGSALPSPPSKGSPPAPAPAVQPAGPDPPHHGPQPPPPAPPP